MDADGSHTVLHSVTSRQLILKNLQYFMKYWDFEH